MRVPRYLEAPVADALKRKMVFVGGPRQVGKTTFALGFLGKGADEQHPGYLNWDHPAVRPRLRNAELPAGEPVLLFDEIHTYARWRNLGGSRVGWSGCQLLVVGCQLPAPVADN